MHCHHDFVDIYLRRCRGLQSNDILSLLELLTAKIVSLCSSRTQQASWLLKTTIMTVISTAEDSMGEAVIMLLTQDFFKESLTLRPFYTWLCETSQFCDSSAFCFVLCEEKATLLPKKGFFDWRTSPSQWSTWAQQLSGCPADLLLNWPIRNLIKMHDKN